VGDQSVGQHFCVGVQWRRSSVETNPIRESHRTVVRSVQGVALPPAVNTCNFGYSAMGIRSHRMDMKIGYHFQ
jgi:hypothetical protein